MATRSSAKLLHSKSYAETHTYPRTCRSGSPTHRFQGAIRILHGNRTSFELSLGAFKLNSQKGCLVWNVTPVQSHPVATSLGPRLQPQTEDPSLWKDTSGWKEKKLQWKQVKKKKRRRREGDQERGESETPLLFSSLLTKQLSSWLFYWHMFFSVSGSTGSADLEMWRAQQPLAPNTFTALSGEERNKHNAHTAAININVLYKYCNIGQVQCHHVCAL